MTGARRSSRLQSERKRKIARARRLAARSGEVEQPKDWARMRPYIFGEEVR